MKPKTWECTECGHNKRTKRTSEDLLSVIHTCTGCGKETTTPKNLLPKAKLQIENIGKPPRLKDPNKRCTAKSKTTNEQCKRPHIPGGTVCRHHGGQIPVVAAAARRRLNEGIMPAISRLIEEVDNEEASSGERIRASTSILDRTGFGPTVEVKVDDAREALITQLRELRKTKLQNKAD